MSSQFLFYRPQPVLIPTDTGVERTFEEFDLSDREIGLCDRRTVFCDVVRSPERDELLCIAPPFLNLGHPKAVLLQGTKREFRVEEPRHDQRVALVRIPLTNADVRASTFDLRFEFADFGVETPVTFKRLELKPVSLILVTIQKDNDPQWVEDWCIWHRRAHGVERVVVYDNGSANAEETYARAAGIDGLDLAVVQWDFPYGPPWRFRANFTQTAALNHCRVTFGAMARWCINLDIDEYLYNDSGVPLGKFVDRRKRRSIHYLTSLIVPMTVDCKPRRCFDTPIRFRQVEARGTKYIYRPDPVAFVGIHHVAAEYERVTFGPFLEMVRTIARRAGVGRALKLRRRIRALARLLDEARRGRRSVSAETSVGPLFFFHFRALNTGWKYQRKVVPVDSEEVVDDPRIARMVDVVETKRR